MVNIALVGRRFFLNTHQLYVPFKKEKNVN